MTSSREGFLWSEDRLTQGLRTDAVVPSTKVLRQSYDVIIIGAGFAGLIAARELARYRQLKVLMVEGRDRIGGRTWTAKAFGEDFEMGGTWVHWNQPHVYSELHRYGLHGNLKTSAGTFAAEKTYYTQPSAAIQEIDGLEYGEIIQKVADRFFEVDGFTSRDLMPYPHDPFREPTRWKEYDQMSIRQRLDQLELPTHHKDLFESTVNSFGSAPGKDTGFVEALRWYALGGHNMAQVFELAGVYKLGKGGMTSFAQAILRDSTCDVLLDTVIVDIAQSQSGHGVELKSKSGRNLQAKAVISTIPLNCLSDVNFTPPLGPLRREAAAQGHINKGAKIHFKLCQVEPGWFSVCNGYGESPFCFAFSDHNGTKPTGPDGTYCIGFGYNGKLQDPRDHATIVEQFNKHLRPGSDVQAYLTHDWMNDPLAKGTWSCWGSGSMSRYWQELQKSHGRVFFASADWADGWRGFVDGALESGKMAARDVVHSLGLPARSTL